MRTQFLTKIAAVSLLSLALACGDDNDTNEPETAQTDLGDLGTSSKADEFEPVELIVDARSEREFEFVSDPGLVFSFTQSNSDPQPNRIFLERKFHQEDDDMAAEVLADLITWKTVVETETSTEHHYTLYTQPDKVRSRYDYKVRVRNEGNQPLQLMMTLQPHEYDPCEQLLRGERDTVLINPLARCSTITSVDDDGQDILKDVDLCIASGHFTSDHPEAIDNPDIRDFVRIRGFMDFDVSSKWVSTLEVDVAVPQNGEDNVSTETEDEITIWERYVIPTWSDTIDDWVNRTKEKTFTFDKNSLFFDAEKKSGDIWDPIEYGYALSCEAYETLDNANTSE